MSRSVTAVLSTVLISAIRLTKTHHSYRQNWIALLMRLLLPYSDEATGKSLLGINF